jgi:hypothetical protein
MLQAANLNSFMSSGEHLQWHIKSNLLKNWPKIYLRMIFASNRKSSLSRPKPQSQLTVLLRLMSRRGGALIWLF